MCLQELTLSPYFAVDAEPSPEALARAEAVPDGPTTDFRDWLELFPFSERAGQTPMGH